MAKREALSLPAKMREELTRISCSRTQPAAKVRRAQIMLDYSEGKRIAQIPRELGTNRPLVERVIDKALSFDPLQALNDLPRPGRAPRITDDARSWVVAVACRKPKELGYAQESWTYSVLIKHLRANCTQAGYPALAKLGKGRLHAILSKSNLKPHKISYYLLLAGFSSPHKGDMHVVHLKERILNKQQIHQLPNYTVMDLYRLRMGAHRVYARYGFLSKGAPARD